MTSRSLGDKIAPLPYSMGYDYSNYFEYRRRSKLPLLLQLGFLTIGALLIIAFAVLANNEPQKADALFSPLVEASNKQAKKEYSYKLLWADPKKIIYKETINDEQTLKITFLSTNLSDVLVSGKRVGLVNFLDESTLLFLEDKEGVGRFIVSKYNISEKTKEEFLAFQAPQTLATGELDKIMAISPDKTQLAIVHESGIVIYTLKTEQENTILENSDVSYRKPLWITNSTLLVYQSAINTLTPMIVNSKGDITAVFPGNLKDLSSSPKGLPFVGATEEGIHIVEPKKTTLVLDSSNGTKYSLPVWFGESNIVASADVDGLPTIIKTDKTGKKVVTLEEFTSQIILEDLINDANGQNIYFTTTSKGDSNISVTFYKMGLRDDKPTSFYSISKNL